MIQSGILCPDDRVELLEGVIVQKVSKNPPHSHATRATRRALDRLAPDGWYIDGQEPISLAASEPEPDLAVLRGDFQDFRLRHPVAGDVGMIVEIAESSLDRDRVLKKRIYAEAEIPWYWIIDLNARRLEAYSRPRNSIYTECTVYLAGDTVPVVLDGVQVGTVPLNDLLP